MANIMNYFLPFCCQFALLIFHSSQVDNNENTQLEKFQEAYSKKDYSAALDFIQKHLSENPKDPLGHHLKGSVHYAKGDNEESIKCFELAVKLNPDQAKSWTGLGKAFYEIQDYKKSLIALQTAAIKKPKDYENYFFMGKALYDLKAYSVAVRCLDKAIEFDPKNKEAKKLRGSCLEKLAFQRLVLVKALAMVEITNLLKEKNRAIPKNVDDSITPKIEGNPDPRPVPKFTGAKAGERLVLKVLGIDVPLRWCPAGSFTMGSPPSEADRSPDEDQVEVKLTRGFWMLETEVTQELWTAVMGTTIEQQNAKGIDSSGVGGKHPVYNVSHDEAVEFCVKLTTLGRAAGLPADFQMHLPSEAQWEYACRAGTTSATAFGNSLSSEQANFAGNFPYGGAAKGPFVAKTTEVGSYKANAWGLFDMHGNVWEWCADWYVMKLPGGQDPQVAPASGDRVIRGGCWASIGVSCRAARRFRFTPGSRYSPGGFRPACSFFEKIQGPAVPIKTAENSLDKDAELFKLNKTIDSVPQVDESDLIGPVFTKNEAKIAQKVLADTLKSPIEGHIKLSDKTQMNMVLIPAGKTIFGTGKDGSDDFEEIDILFPFYMGKFEVTVDQFRTYAKETGYKTDAEKSKYGHGFNKGLNKFIDGVSRSEGDENDFYWGYTGFELQGSSPVVNLTVNDMNVFVLWLRKKTGLYLDFPTPREWTYAAKAGVGTKYNWGDEFQNFEKFANFRGIGTDKRQKVLTPVGSFEPNAFGLHDVLGNVWEICKNDKAEPDWYYGMGGSFFSKQKCCQLGHYHSINKNNPENALNLYSYEVGFRLIIRLSDNKN